MNRDDSRPLVRGNALLRQWRLLVLLRRRRTLHGLASALGVSTRTIRRDLAVLESVPFPLVRARPESFDGAAVWSLSTMQEWPKDEPCPVRELRS